MFGRHRAFLGYLNITPRQGAETLSGWTRFRLEHNAEEGERGVTGLASTAIRRAGGQRWSCVKDAYRTAAGPSYVELACLIAGPRSTVVAVGASPPQAWPRVSPLLERAIASVRA